MLNQETAKAARTDSGYILRAPRRMRVADAVAQYMRVPVIWQRRYAPDGVNGLSVRKSPGSLPVRCWNV